MAKLQKAQLLMCVALPCVYARVAMRVDVFVTLLKRISYPLLSWLSPISITIPCSNTWVTSAGHDRSSVNVLHDYFSCTVCWYDTASFGENPESCRCIRVDSSLIAIDIHMPGRSAMLLFPFTVSIRSKNCYIYTPIAFVCNEAYENCGKYFPLKDTCHMTEELTSIWFFRLFRGFSSL